MAGIYKRGKTWWGRVQRGGQEFRQSLQTRSESVARKRLRQWLDRLEAAAWGEKPLVTLNEIADRFIREHLPNIRHQSARRYGVSLAHLDRELGHMMLNTIGSAQLVEFETARRSVGVSAPTIRRDLACLSSLFGFAIEREIVDVNPVSAFLKRARKRGLRESEARTRYLSHAEERALITEVGWRAMPTAGKPDRKRLKGPRNGMMLSAAVIVALNSGLRLREQLDMTWEDIDLARKVARVAAARAKGRKTREVVLFEPAISVLRTLPRHIKSRSCSGTATAHASATSIAASRLRPDGRKLFDLRWHDLRRTHGCRLLQDHGWSIEMVQAQLGHQNVTQTQKAYAFLEIEQRLARAGKCAAVESDTTESRNAAGLKTAMNAGGTD